MAAKTELEPVAGTKSEGRSADIVFVHGLDGDKRDTWQDGEYNDSFWPLLLSNDLPTCGVWSFGYDARSSEWIHGSTMPIVDRANNFAAFLRSEGLGKKPIFFVTHSLGGLIVKQVLRSLYDKDRRDPIVAQTRRVFFFATPHAGSKVPNIVSWLSFYRPTIIMKELESAAAPLRDLNKWYQNNAEDLGIATTVFFETKKTGGFLIVDEASADPGIPAAEVVPVDDDHINICKVDISTMPYKIVRNHIEELVRANSKAHKVIEESPLWLHVSCFNKYPDQWEEKTIPKSPMRNVEYKAVFDNDKLVVSPDLPYLNAVRQAKPVTSLTYMWQPFRWLPLNLDLKFLNKSDETIYLTNVRLDVRQSRLNPEPILIVKRGDAFPYFCISNDGWGTIREPSLQLEIVDGGGELIYPEKFSFEVPITSFSDFAEFDLSEQFASLGVDVEGVLTRSANPNTGVIHSGVAHVYGALKFLDEGGRECTFRFVTDMSIEGPACGMYGPPTFDYGTRLEVEGVDYRRDVAISQVINPGESDRFLLQIDVDKSSIHELSLIVESKDRVVANVSPIELSLLVPRSVHSRVSDIDTRDDFYFR
ncbi:MAG: hypothetical protein NXI22_02215 [bacterium]|nr:hypothetical protein [bacterium]